LEGFARQAIDLLQTQTYVPLENFTPDLEIAFKGILVPSKDPLTSGVANREIVDDIYS
jgi:hypothetical protein